DGEKRRRGRPSKNQTEPEQQPPHSASSFKPRKRGRRSSRSTEVDQPPAQKKPSSSHSTCELLNAVYERANENEGTPTDPFLRVFKPLMIEPGSDLLSIMNETCLLQQSL
ncbi:hypothetical protein PIB30_048862, partial [Stylosanthes scabra]|nr:hypothetical protein [Stylosanthes scabra]